MATILIADDSKFARRFARAILEKEFDGDIVEATNGFEAIAQYAQHKPTLTLLDLSMPELDGIGAMKQILAADPDACLVVLCGGSAQTEEELTQLGAAAVVHKPLEQAAAKDLVATYLTTKSA